MSELTNEPKLDYLKLLIDRKYFKDKRPERENVLFTVRDKTIGTAGNYCVFSGLPKVGKSTFITALISSFILPNNEKVFNMKLYPVKDRNRIAYFDTESSPYDFYNSIDRIKTFSSREDIPHNIDCFNCRKDGPYMIRKLIENYLHHWPDCSIVIIDGFLDLCFNYNDEVETRKLTNWFKRITEIHNILLIGVLHLGKGGNETLGHLGSNSDRWAQSTLTIEKSKLTKQIVLKPKFLRSSDEFEEVALMNFNGRWHEVPYEPEPEPIKKGNRKM